LQDLISLMPAVKRARAYRLYDYKGRRYLDLYQNNGHAILGHRANRVTGVIKQVMEKGLIFDLNSIYEKRVIKALSVLFPHYKSFRLYNSKTRALDVLSLYFKKKIDLKDIADPVLTDNTAALKQISLWRPFLSVKIRPQVLLPVLPFQVAEAPIVVGFKKKLDPHLLLSDIISPMLLAGLTRSIYDLIKYELPLWLKDDIVENNCSWKQKGVYVIPLFEKERYIAVFREFLHNGYLLNPYFPAPSILPASVSEGELKKMIKLFKQNPGD
jgi:hypothetical protein